MLLTKLWFFFSLLARICCKSGNSEWRKPVVWTGYTVSRQEMHLLTKSTKWRITQLVFSPKLPPNLVSQRFGFSDNRLCPRRGWHRRSRRLGSDMRHILPARIGCISSIDNSHRTDDQPVGFGLRRCPITCISQYAFYSLFCSFSDMYPACFQCTTSCFAVSSFPTQPKLLSCVTRYLLHKVAW